MNPAAGKRLRLLASALSVLVVVAAGALGWFYSRMRASLPRLEGAAVVAGLSAPATIFRDSLGVPTIRGDSRADVARALGWLHAQDRFFQMDVLRRNSAGELAEAFGRRGLARDRANRRHGFRKLAQQVVANLPPRHREILEAYTAGVNAGLRDLGARPFEYYVARELPQPWRPEDTILVAYTMTLDLQDETGRYEKTLMTLRDQLGKDALAFFAPVAGPDDAALDASTAPVAPLPGPRIINLAARKLSHQLRSGHENQTTAFSPPGGDGTNSGAFGLSIRNPDTFPGSNAFALGGAHTANHAGLLANDMHLDHGLPNTWYRASLEFPAVGKNGAAATRKVTGVTLPGTPLVIAGSNGQVAWGFTNAYVDTVDLVVVEPVSGLTTWYATPKSQSVKIDTRTETITVKGQSAVIENYDWTIWGPIVDKDERERPLALRWTAHDPSATNLGLLALEDVADVTAAIAVAHGAGMPAQNIVMADTAGNVAWTIAGRLPRRVGYDGRLPVSWAYGDRRWDGWVPPEQIPVIRYSADATTGSQRIWSANQRAVGGEMLEKLGDGGYARPNRAGQIRDRLAALERATPRDMLQIQLDDRALFLTPWRQLLLETLSPEAVGNNAGRKALRGYAEKWEGRASVEAKAYPLVKQFRIAVYQRVFSAIFASCLEADPGFVWPDLHLEPALWAILREKPKHLLNPQHASWPELLVAAVDDVIYAANQESVQLPVANWGHRNRVQLRHPFGYNLPDWLGRWLNLPPESLPGDIDMPRVQQPRHGASERLVVSPGHEEEGIFHMPGGQSGHPLSPYYRAGHEAWTKGEPTPFLPGKPAHTLVLNPPSPPP
ncbi:MAG: hypothetical protein RIQ93_773 [Verrucomicrobiota bacterium]